MNTCVAAPCKADVIIICTALKIDAFGNIDLSVRTCIDSQPFSNKLCIIFGFIYAERSTVEGNILGIYTAVERKLLDIEYYITVRRIDYTVYSKL